MLTQKELARKLNVSQQTISRALRKPMLLRESTRKRILDAIERHNYSRNELANAFKTKRQDVIGVIVPRIELSYFPQVVAGIEQEARQRQWQVMLTCSHRQLETEHQQLQMMRNLRLGGVILTPLSSPEFYRQIRLQMPPMVMIDAYLPRFRCPYAGTDNRLGGRLATEHLIALGHRRIGLVVSSTEMTSTANRHAGFQRAMADHNLAVAPTWIFQAGFDRQDGRRAFEQLRALPQADRPTAVFCDHDNAAVGLMLEAIEHGWRIPHDLSIVGFADLDWTELLPVPLTTIAQPAQATGAGAVELLFEQLDHGRKTIRRVELAPKLVVRQSTAPPPSPAV